MTRSPRPKIRKRGCVVVLGLVLVSWAAFTGLAGGLVYLVDKLT